MANPYTVNPLGGFDLGQGIRGLGQDLERKEEKERLKQQRQEMQSAILGARQGDEAAMDRLFSLNPNLAMNIEKNSRQLEKEGRLEATKNAAVQWLGSEPGSMEREVLKERFFLDENIDFGEDEQNMTDEQFDLATNLFLRQQGIGQGQAGMPAETRAFNELIKDFSPEDQLKAKKIKAGLKGRAMSNAVLSAIESGDVENLADANALIKQQEKFAEATGASRAKFIDEGFKTVGNITKNIRNIDKAIDALDRGAKTGVVEGKFFPSITAASRELNQIQNELALDIIGAVTFGALSQGELDLAKETALDTGLSEEALRDQLIRKKAAQEKLQAYFEEQIDFLDRGGTVAGFLREKKRQQQGASTTQQQPEQPSIEELMKKYGNP